MAFSAFPLSFASPFHLCANSQISMTFKLPFFYGFHNSAFNLKSRRQRHITPINLFLFNSDSMKKLFHNNFTTSQFKRSSHSSGFHLQVIDAQEINDSEDPMDREDDKHDTQQTPSNKPKVRECNMKPLLCKHSKASFKSSYMRIHYHFFGAPDGKKVGIQRCKELIRDRALHDRIRAKVLHAEKEDASTGAEVADTMKNDEFWDDVENIVRITKPLFLLIKFCDGEGPKMVEVYERMDNMLGELKEIMKDNVHKDDYLIVKQIVLDRWETMNIPIHCLGFALNPRFYDANFLKILAPGGVERKPPNLDSEEMSGVLEAFRKITESKEEEKLLRGQYVVFHQRKRGLFAKLACQEDAVHINSEENCNKRTNVVQLRDEDHTQQKIHENEQSEPKQFHDFVTPRIRVVRVSVGPQLEITAVNPFYCLLEVCEADIEPVRQLLQTEDAGDTDPLFPNGLVLNLECKGAQHLDKQKEVRSLLVQYKMGMVGVLETKVKKQIMGFVMGKVLETIKKQNMEFVVGKSLNIQFQKPTQFVDCQRHCCIPTHASMQKMCFRLKPIELQCLTGAVCRWLPYSRPLRHSRFMLAQRKLSCNKSEKHSNNSRPPVLY
ncbi:hypothetical protein Cgig2_003306 [Carnegiea gigantea]|uniref:Uncharacterized protein n=1 Tax=Carnegiea gigantea TaxID=171969 RepID=A0A9Q1K388_9CARY|nr:hypothetical protein Cgig2_003306 [Carnegiea gigantea]